MRSRILNKKEFQEYCQERKEERKQYQKNYREKNKERLKKQAHLRYQQKMKDEDFKKARNEKNKLWRKENPKYYNIYFKERYLRDENFRESKKEKARENSKKYREKVYVRNHNYRARRMKAEGTFTFEEWQNVLKQNNFMCVFCGSKEHLTKDHIIPLSKGGSNFIGNLQPLCRSCNARKHNSILSELIRIG